MDYLIPVAKKDIEIAQVTIKSILMQDSEAMIVVVTNEKYIDNFIGAKITILDEDKLIQNLNFNSIEDIIVRLMNQSERVGWYFQQFIKMAYSLVAERNYVIWDSDTVMLKKMVFLEGDKNILYFNNVIEHSPYLVIMEKLFPNIKVIKNISFITEKLFVDLEIMREIIHLIESRFSKPFFEVILENIEESNLVGSGFSEFATYANYALHYYPNNHKLEKSSHYRSGTMIFGELPELDELQSVSHYYYSISFEKWQKKCISNRKVNKFLLSLMGFNLYSMFVFLLSTFIFKIRRFKEKSASS